MKQIVCEMCGSNNLVKEGDNFVCQDCGTKYSVEAARKLMVEVEGKVDVSGSSVKIDNTTNVQNFLANARRAKQKEDWNDMERYYNMVEQNDPSNIEAIFYSAYGRAKQTLVSSDLYKRQSEFKVLNNSVSIIDDNFNVENAAEQIETVKQISSDVLFMMNSSFVYNQTKNGYGIVIRTDKQATYNLFINLAIQFDQTLINIYKKLKNEQVAEKIEILKLRINQNNYVLNATGTSRQNKQVITETILPGLHAEWNKLDPEHVIPEANSFVPAEKRERDEKWAKQLPTASIVCGVIFWPIGLIYSLLGLKKAKAGEKGYPENKKKYFIGLIVSCVVAASWLAAIIRIATM